MPDLLDIIHREWPTIKAAPYSFAITIIATAALLWAFFEWRHRRRIENPEGGGGQSLAPVTAGSSVANSGNSAFNQTFVLGSDQTSPATPPELEDPIPSLDFLGYEHVRLRSDRCVLVEHTEGAEALVAEFQNTLYGVGTKTPVAYAVTAQLTFRTDKGKQVYLHHGTWVGAYTHFVKFDPGKNHRLIVLTRTQQGALFSLENHNSSNPFARRPRSGLTIPNPPQAVSLPEGVYSVEIALVEDNVALYQHQFVLAADPDGTMRLA